MCSDVLNAFLIVHGVYIETIRNEVASIKHTDVFWFTLKFWFTLFYIAGTFHHLIILSLQDGLKLGAEAHGLESKIESIEHLKC